MAKIKNDEFSSHKDAVYRAAKALIDYYDAHHDDYGFGELLEQLRGTIKNYEADMYVAGTTTVNV